MTAGHPHVEAQERRAALTACVLVIGNEILSGKVQESNAYYLCTELRALGVQLRRIVVVPDEIEAIVAEARAVVAGHDVVFTSGGVGPTHDDVTLQALALAFGRPMVRNAELEGLLRGHYGERTTAHHLRMADLPDGVELIASADLRWPVVRLENVYILPGVPEIFRRKFDSVKERFRQSPFHLRVIYTRQDEGHLGAHLDATVAAFPGVDIGSYPRIDITEYRVKLTLESKDEALVTRAAADLLSRLAPDQLVDPEVARQAPPPGPPAR
jgi:molybdenum cofactor synthesis domain-containing protein